MISVYRGLEYNIKLILITTLFSNIGIFMVIPFLSIYLNDLNSISTADVGIIIGVAFWCQRAGSLLGGLLSDYFDIKKTLLIGLVIRIPGYLVLGFVNDFYLLLLSCVAIGVGSSIYLPAAKSFLVKHTSEHMRVDVLSLRVVFSNIGVAIGPVIGLVVFEMSPYILFSLVGIIFAILLIMNGLLTDCPRSKHTRELKALDLLRLSTNIKMLIIAISTFIFMAMYMQIEVTVPLLAKELYDKSTVSAIFVINAAVVVLLQVYVSRWACDMRNNNPIAIGFLLFSISFFLLDLSSYGQSIVFLSVIFFTLAEIIFQIRLDYETTLVNEKMVASSFGLMSLAAAFGGLFGSYAGSLLYQSDLKGISFWEWLCYFTLILSIIYFVKSYAKGFNYEASCNDKPS